MNGRIGLYSSPSYIGDHVGTRGMIKVPEGTGLRYTHEDLSRIEVMSDWLRENSRIYRDRPFTNGNSFLPNVPEVIRTSQQTVRVDVNNSALQEELMMPVYEGGPQTANKKKKFENLVIFGVDDTRELVKYGNPRLVGDMFPNLYVSLLYMARPRWCTYSQ